MGRRGPLSTRGNKKRSFTVTFKGGPTVEVRAKGRKHAIAKACSKTGKGPNEVDSWESPRKSGPKWTW